MIHFAEEWDHRKTASALQDTLGWYDFDTEFEVMELKKKKQREKRQMFHPCSNIASKQEVHSKLRTLMFLYLKD